jgi:soluble lytic murein transglycosylase-like protein
MSLDFIQATNSQHPTVDKWNDLLNEICPAHKVPPNLVKAHILYESNGDPNVVSFDDGCGLCQITAGVNVIGNGQDTKYIFQDRDILDPAWNIEVACRFFIAPNLARFPDNLDAAIAAYNAGANAVEAALRGGKLPSTVTYDPQYVTHVRGAYYWFVSIAHKGGLA